jgi:hypothetical protein
VSNTQAIGILHCLWWWCLDYAPDGDLTDMDAATIADACEWEGDPDELIAAFIGASARRGGCGFVDNGDGLKVHDWDDYAGSLIGARERNAERMRASRAGHVQDTLTARGGLERKKEREKERARENKGHNNQPVDNSTVRPVVASGQEPERHCWRCGNPISGDAILDDLAVLSKKGIRHKECPS